MAHARSPGDGTSGSTLRALAAELPSADQALDELIARANQAEVAVGDDEVVEETVVEPAVIVGDGRAQALEAEIVALQRKLDAADARGRAQAMARRSPPWLAIAGGFAGGLVVMFAVARLTLATSEPVPPVAAAPGVTATPIEPASAAGPSSASATAAERATPSPASATAAAPAAPTATAQTATPAELPAAAQNATPAAPAAKAQPAAAKAAPVASSAPSKPRPPRAARSAAPASEPTVARPAGALADPFAPAAASRAKPADPPTEAKKPAALVNPF